MTRFRFYSISLRRPHLESCEQLRRWGRCWYDICLCLYESEDEAHTESHMYYLFTVEWKRDDDGFSKKMRSILRSRCFGHGWILFLCYNRELWLWKSPSLWDGGLVFFSLREPANWEIMRFKGLASGLCCTRHIRLDTYMSSTWGMSRVSLVYIRLYNVRVSLD